MIICTYEELKQYKSVLPRLQEALNCVEELRKQDFPTGRYEYDGGFLFVQRGNLKPFDQDAYETHRKYIDVQYMIEGGETIYYAPVNELEECKAYNALDDIAFYTGKAHQGTRLEIRPEMCWVAKPEDAHMPCRDRGDNGADDERKYVKIVMKLPCDERESAKKEQEWIEELKEFDTPTITNVIATYPEKKEYCLGLYNPWEDSWYTNEDIKCMYPELGRQVGYAVTVTFGLPDERHEKCSFKELYRVLAEAPKPVILCIKQNFPERYRKKNGLAGGNMMTAFKSLGCVGVISDGPSRDVDEVRGIGIQYMLTGVTAGHGPFVIQAINTEVELCDMKVRPGEIIHMDENGAVKFPAEYLEEVCRRSRKLNEFETKKQQLFAVNQDPEIMYLIKTGKYQG